ncbi:hypothetical protein SteCoe_26096 [Stentor coeruleus]|uniref:RING-type domain-containing protein n=1 Tax=Stentor coeruleus TaxID=5963 RepID=A0A1R2BDQ1_9CILI|nr:hypothetical protein SteCoe_26096 [Stentor coeruleus]
MSWEVPNCSICLQDLNTELAAITCGHIYHYQCIIDSIHNKTKACPLCREKILPSKILKLNYSLNLINKPHEQLGMTEENSKDIEALHSKIKKIKSKRNFTRTKLGNYEREIKAKDEEISNLTIMVNKVQEMRKNFEDMYYEARSSLRDKTYDANKYMELFKSTHEKMKEYEDKATSLESISKLLIEIDQNNSTVMWAKDVRENMPLEDQASQFYSALLILSTNSMSQDKSFKELKSQHSICSDEMTKLKRTISLLRKENERLAVELDKKSEPLELKVRFK